MAATPAVVITGGTSGIGLEAVKRFCAKGYQVFTCARRDFDFSRILNEVDLARLEFTKLDVADTPQLVEWLNSIGIRTSIDVLINNAAAVYKKPIQEFSSVEFQNSLAVNLLAVLEGLKAALDYFSPDRGGVVINVSSMAAVDPFEGFAVYGACKAFLELFTQATATELRPRNIRCYAIRAGTVETPLLRRVLPDFPDSEALDPKYVAELMFQLANGKSRFKNGSSIEISFDNAESLLRLTSNKESFERKDLD